jgi:ATP-dependent protease ClpP protease subunit
MISKLIISAILVVFAAMPTMASSKIKTIELTPDNTVTFAGQVNSSNVSAAIEEIQALANSWSRKVSNEPIYLVLYTPGGSIQKGLEFVEVVKGLGIKVHTITIFSASMGFAFAQMLDDRYVLSSGIFMSHRAYGGAEGEYGGEQPDQMTNRQSIWKERIREIDELTVKRTKGKQTLESYLKAYSSEMWRTGPQAVSEGYADAIVRIRCDSALSTSTQTRTGTVNTMLGAIPVEFSISKCPLNTSPKDIKVLLETTHGSMSDSDFIKKGGSFGPECLADTKNKSRLCALNPLIDQRLVSGTKNTFKTQFEDLRNSYKKSEW